MRSDLWFGNRLVAGSSPLAPRQTSAGGGQSRFLHLSKIIGRHLFDVYGEPELLSSVTARGAW
jgi:hypothetical protein